MKTQTVVVPMPDGARVPARLHNLIQSLVSVQALLEDRRLSTVVCHPTRASDGWVVRCTLDCPPADGTRP